jgi:hypothetical protein
MLAISAERKKADPSSSSHAELSELFIIVLAIAKRHPGPLVTERIAGRIEFGHFCPRTRVLTR